ncbi:MAG: type VI secretion system tube protein Hcp [Gemmatimonadetes bacterium]|nr:type VI secretion system tube protein Hcp [Gemmatimonadota bacterium]
MSAVDYFLKIDGIEGEATDAKHKAEIDIESYSWGAQQTVQAVGAAHGSGKVVMQDFSFSMRVCKATPKLMLACASGQHIKQAVLACRRAGGEQQEYYVVKMSEVLISSYETAGSVGDVVPTDKFALNFSKIEFEYKEQKADGTMGSPVKTGWNVKENKKI